MTDIAVAPVPVVEQAVLPVMKESITRSKDARVFRMGFKKLNPSIPRDFVPEWFSSKCREECQAVLKQGGWRFHDVVDKRSMVPVDGATHIYCTVEFRPIRQWKLTPDGQTKFVDGDEFQYAVYYHKTPAEVLARMATKASSSKKRK